MLCLCYQLLCSRSAQIRLYMTARWNILYYVCSYVLNLCDLKLLYATRMVVYYTGYKYEYPLGLCSRRSCFTLSGA